MSMSSRLTYAMDTSADPMITCHAVIISATHLLFGSPPSSSVSACLIPAMLRRFLERGLIVAQFVRAKRDHRTVNSASPEPKTLPLPCDRLSGLSARSRKASPCCY